MKKLWMLILAVSVLLLVLTGCTKEGEDQAQIDGVEQGQQTETDQPENPESQNPNLSEDSTNAGDSEQEQTGSSEAQDEESQNEADTEDSNTTQSVDLQAFFEDIQTQYDLGSLTDIEGELMDNYYPGLSDYTFVQYVGKAPMMTSVVSEYIFAECESEEDAEKVAEILQARIDSQVEGGAWYPESIEAWNQAKVVQEGTFVALVASAENTDAIVTAFEDLFKA